MTNEIQHDLLSDLSALDFLRMMLADLHNDLAGRTARFRQLADLSSALGAGGTMIYGGEVSYSAWVEARDSFVQGNYIATVLLCQSLAEHSLAAYLSVGLDAEPSPKRIAFRDTLQRCVTKKLVSPELSNDLLKLMELRNPLSHFRDISDPSNLSRRAIDTRMPANEHLRRDASFALKTMVSLLALAEFSLSGDTLA